VLDVDGQHFSDLMKMSLTLAVPLCMVQFEYHLLALVLLLPSNVQDVMWVIRLKRIYKF
jgi:hypothetical protein